MRYDGTTVVCKLNVMKIRFREELTIALLPREVTKDSLRKLNGKFNGMSSNEVADVYPAIFSSRLLSEFMS